MNTNQRVLELLRRAVAILEDETLEPNAPSAQTAPWEVNEGEVILEGTIGRPELKIVGSEKVCLFTAGIKTRREHDGRPQWHNLIAWRRVAEWANDNLASGSVVRAIGRFEKQSWTTPEGESRERDVFSVRMFEAA